MAGASLLALLDDIATILDDVAVLSKVATKKTAGVLGDDLALNAQQLTGVRAARELPVVWAVAKGSLLNKAILVPAALAISAVAPWAVTPLLMVGGLYLCFEGCEKLAHKFLHDEAETQAKRIELLKKVADPDVDLVAAERNKIKGAIRTDFILSAEIIIIALGIVADAAFGTRVAVMVTIAVLITAVVYGLVATIVKLDDVGAYLAQPQRSAAAQATGRGIVAMAPWLMKGLSIAGTAAMFLVGGGILVHGIPLFSHWAHALEAGLGPMPGWLAPALFNALVGIAAGAVVLSVVTVIQRLRSPHADA